MTNSPSHDSGDEELGAVGVRAGVRHGKDALLGVLELEVLVGELLTIDYSAPSLSDNRPAAQRERGLAEGTGLHTGLATGAVALGEVAALDHELLDDTVERRSLVAEALLSRGQSAEVLDRLGYGLAVETHDDATDRLIAVRDVKVHLVGDLGTLGRGHGLREEEHADAQQQHGRQEQTPDAEHPEQRADALYTRNMR